MTCLAPDCTNPPRTRGLCKTHYERWRRGRFNIEPLPHREPKPCTIDGCTRQQHAKGLCDAHARRLREWGDPRPDLPLRSDFTPQECSIDGCGRQAKARGWCSPHWDRWDKHGDPMPDVPINGRVAHRPDCSICEESEWASHNWVSASRIADGCGIRDASLRDHLSKFRPDLLGWFHRTRQVAS